MHLFRGKKTNHTFLPFVEETVPLFSVSAFSERQLPAAGVPPMRDMSADVTLIAPGGPVSPGDTCAQRHQRPAPEHPVLEGNSQSVSAEKVHLLPGEKTCH